MARRTNQGSPPAKGATSSRAPGARTTSRPPARVSSPPASRQPDDGSGELSAEPVTGGSEAMLSIGDLALATHASTRTIRYYEELGILPAPPRSVGGTRRYPREYIFYLEGARALKQLGFSLEEIAEIGKWALGGKAASARTRSMLREKVRELEHRIRVLNRLHDLVLEAADGSRRAESPVPTLLAWLGSEHSSGAAEAH